MDALLPPFSLPPSLSSLPDDVLLEILHRLPTLQRLSAQSVCARWRDLLRHPSLWQHLNLEDAPHLSSRQVVHLVGLTALPDGHGFGLRSLRAAGTWQLEVSQLLPALQLCLHLEALQAVASPTGGRPQVTAASLPALARLCEAGGAISASDAESAGSVEGMREGEGEGEEEIGSNLQAVLGGERFWVGGANNSRPRGGGENFLFGGENRIGGNNFRTGAGRDNFTGRTDNGSSLKENIGRGRVSRRVGGTRVEVDLEVDWSTEEELDETASQLTESEWSLVFAAVGEKLPLLRVRALYIEIFSVEQTWPLLLSSLRTNTSLQELYIVCLHCDVLTLGDMLSSLADALEAGGSLRVAQIKYAEFRSPLHLRPLLRLCSGVSSSLRRLELIKCDFPFGAELGLAELLSADTLLEELVVDGGGKAEAIAPALASNTTLKILRLQGVVECGVIKLGEALQHNKTLVELDLRHMMVTHAGLMALAAALHENKSLRTLRLDHGQVDYFLATEELVEALEAVVAAVEQRGGMDVLGVSAPDGFWLTSSKAPFLSLPKRFYEPSLARIATGPSPLVKALHITSPWEEWQAGDAAAWRLWFGLSCANEGGLGASAEALSRRGETPGKGVRLHLLHDGGGEVEVWATHAWVPALSRHVAVERSAWARAGEALLVAVFPAVHVWESVAAVHRAECARYSCCLDWCFLAPLALVRTAGLVAGLLALYLVLYAQALALRLHDAARRLFLPAPPPGEAPEPKRHPTALLRTPEGHRLLRNIV